MSILDELIEKKNLTIYIDCRIAQLRRLIKDAAKQPIEKKRQIYIQRIVTRIKELKLLRKYINNGTLKKQSVQLWRDINKTQTKIPITEIIKY